MCAAVRSLHCGLLSGSGVAMSLNSTKLDSSACRSSRISASLDQGQVGVEGTKADIVVFEETKKRIRKLLDNVEISVSAYDTAWVAMVPSMTSQQAPRFPQCINWLLDNQHSDGSWGLHHHQPFLMKDALLSTLACILALKKWGIGERQINKGIEFFVSNLASVNDSRQHAPIGFDIIFPGMIEYARDLNLNFPLVSSEIDAFLRRRDSDLTSLPKGREGCLTYFSEGMGILKDWESILKHQRKNGSLFNSPATTAAALAQVENSGLYQYLHSVLQKFENSVPTVYPFDRYVRLSMVDTLDSLGIDRHFKKEIRRILDDTYRCWLEKEEDICLDVHTYALALRLLLVNAYDVSTDGSIFFGSLEGYPKDTAAVLQLFKAAQINAYPDEPVLEKKLTSWTQSLKMELTDRLNAKDGLGEYLKQEIQEALNFPFYANLDRLAHRRKIESYYVDSTRVLKTSYRSDNISNPDFLKLAVCDFNFCQSIHREELEMLDRWIAEKRLQKLKFARQKLAYCYFSAAATLFPPELSDARISWAKGGVLTTVIDDFFDVGASQEEMENLIQLVEREDLNDASGCCSEHVEIIFSALRSTILETQRKALVYQGRDVMNHLKQIWLDLLKSMMKEAEWSRNKTVPTLEEYMENGYVSFALGPIVLPAIYLVGPKLSHEIIKSPEFNKLYKFMSTIGRLQNDMHSFNRESKEGKLNAVSLRMSLVSGGREEVVESMKGSVSSLRKELMRLVYGVKGSLVPRDCKELFWKMSKVLHLFYMKEDGFTSQNLHGAVNSVLHEPVSIRK